MRITTDIQRSADTAEYIEALNQIPGFGGLDLIQTKRGNGGGTWGHPKLAVFFATWLDVTYSSMSVIGSQSTTASKPVSSR